MERIYRTDNEGISQVVSLLESQNLKLDKHLDEIYLLRNDSNQVVGTGSIHGNVLKCIAVSDDVKGTNAVNTIVGFLINRCYESDRTHLFIYTKPCAYKSFEYFGFKKIIETEKLVLMENGIEGIDKYLDFIGVNKLNKEKVASVVLNCNPFTLGHKHLVHTAADENDWVHVFVVWEDKSTFPRDIRYKLVCEGLSDIKNITVHKGMDYIISGATFPSYFLGDDNDVVKEQTNLDLKIFGERIAPKLNIKRRYVGKEPFNGTTAKYNETMKELLPKYDIEVIEIDRKETEIGPISASTVRSLLASENYDELRKLVPDSTFTYLTSEDASETIKKLTENYDVKNLV